MRLTVTALTVLCLGWAGAPPAFAQAAGSGAGQLPGSQFQRQLDGGPGYVCTATNALRTQQCTASCPSRETADCEDADASDTPTCRCTAE